MFVRIQTHSGQIKQTEVEPDTDSILEQIFIQHEIVKDFKTPLTQRYGELRQDMLEKMSAVIDGISS